MSCTIFEKTPYNLFHKYFIWSQWRRLPLSVTAAVPPGQSSWSSTVTGRPAARTYHCILRDSLIELVLVIDLEPPCAGPHPYATRGITGCLAPSQFTLCRCCCRRCAAAAASTHMTLRHELTGSIYNSMNCKIARKLFQNVTICSNLVTQITIVQLNIRMPASDSEQNGSGS